MKRNLDAALRGQFLAAFALLLLLATSGFLLRRSQPQRAVESDSQAPSPASSGAGQRREPAELRAQLLRSAPVAASAARPGAARSEALAYLIETSDDPRVVIAALRDVPSTYAARSTRKPSPGPELQRAIAKHVRSPNPSVLAAALDAARVALLSKEPADELTLAIAEQTRAERDPARRAASLAALDLLRPDRRAPHVLTALEQALAAREPYLVSLALLALSDSGPSLEALSDAERARIAEQALAHGADADPGVRGRVLALLAEVPAFARLELRVAAGQQRLADAHHYVSAQAADLLQRCRQPAAIHRLIELGGDLALARYELAGWRQLDGSAGTLLHVVPGRPTVAEAALQAIRSLSELVPGVSVLSLTLAAPPQPQDAILRNVQLAKSWYRAQAARIPQSLSSPDASAK